MLAVVITQNVTDAETYFLALDISIPDVPTLWVEVAIDIILPPPKPIHRDPVTQGFHLTPDFRIPLLDPCLDMRLLLTVGGAIEPAAQATDVSKVKICYT